MNRHACKHNRKQGDKGGEAGGLPPLGREGAAWDEKNEEKETSTTRRVNTHARTSKETSNKRHQQTTINGHQFLVEK